MKYLQSDNSKNTYGLYGEEIGPGHLIAIIEFETVADGDKLIRPIAAARALLAKGEAALIQMTALGNSLNWEGVTQQYVDEMNGLRAAIAEAREQ